jgi:uncharacterized protein YbjQ (UPF0145 family)
MPYSTTPTFEGKVIKLYKGIVAGEAVMGANFVKDMLANMADLTGTRASGYEKTLEKGRKIAFEIMEAKAHALGADAIVGVKIDYQVLGEHNGMLMVAVSGTAVVTGLAAESKKSAEEKLEEIARYYLRISGREKGPFSKIQLREMIQGGSLQASTECRSESSTDWMTVATVLIS